MTIFNFIVFFLLIILGDNTLNAASITINNVNINWQYGELTTNFSINATLSGGIDPGLFVFFFKQIQF